MKVFGLFYTHNQVHPQILKNSLNSIIYAARTSACQAQILISSWKPIDLSGVELNVRQFAWGMHHPSHLSILLQIRSLLLRKDIDLNSICCMLEHDVLYPPGYFDDVVKGFGKNPMHEAVQNTNYIGLNQTGWLKKVWGDEDKPMHQCSMLWPALRDTNSMKIDEVLKGGQIIEPYHVHKFQTKFQAVHMNGSKPFSSHFDCYEKQSSLPSEHEFWGDYRDWYPMDEKAYGT